MSQTVPCGLDRTIAPRMSDESAPESTDSSGYLPLPMMLPAVLLAKLERIAAARSVTAAYLAREWLAERIMGEPEASP